MTGGLRWPLRPPQATCVLVAVLPPAAQCFFARGPDANLSERSKTNTITIVSANPNPVDLKITDVIPALNDEGCFPHARRPEQDLTGR